MRRKNIVLLVLALTSFLAGAVNQYFYPGADFPKSDIPFILLSLFLLFYWYHLDAIEQSYPRTVFLNICVILIAALAMPYYFFRSRGFKKGLIATIRFFALIVLFNFITLGGQYATYYGLQT